MKSYLKLILFLAVVIASIYFWKPVESSFCVSDLLLQNVEALASDEKPQSIDCMGTGSVSCPLNNSKVKYVFETLY